MVKLTTIIISLLIFITLNSTTLYSQDIEEDEEYVLDDIPTMNLRPGSRFLAKVLKKGARCTALPVKYNICNGVKANKGTSLLKCCKKHCRNILADRNNCGKCGRKCKPFGERCCKGKCTNVVSNRKNCGKCGKKCAKGVKCEFNICGYN